jgi:predicted DsbA family dithiol-disulfide isomerase
MAKQLNLEVWSDIVCPWCYVGKRRLEAALARFPGREQVHITWRSFELDASAPKLRDEQPYAERLAKKYGTTPAQAQGMIDRMVGVAKAEGLDFDFTRAQPGNTFDAHRLLHLARDRELQGALKERLFRAYLCQGEAISDHDTLARLASEVGLSTDEVQAVLSTDQYASEVRADEAQARAIGIDGVPFFVLAERYAVAGAQPAELLASALEKAWSELPDIERLDIAPDAEGAVCGPDGCS